MCLQSSMYIKQLISTVSQGYYQEKTLKENTQIITTNLNLPPRLSTIPSSSTKPTLFISLRETEAPVESLHHGPHLLQCWRTCRCYPRHNLWDHCSMFGRLHGYGHQHSFQLGITVLPAMLHSSLGRQG